VEQPEEQRRQQGGAERTVTILELGEDESGPSDLLATLFSTIMIANAGRNAGGTSSQAATTFPQLAFWTAASVGSGRPRFDDIGLGGGDHRDRPDDDVFGDSGLPHGGHQMSGDRGEVIMADSEAGVGLVKRASVVVCRATEHLRYQEHLVALKSRKVDPLEVRGKPRIAQNALIKIVHDSAYGRSPANDVVVTQAPASRLVTHACSSFRVADVANKFTFTCHV